MIHSVFALLLLLVATVLAVYKPKGLTPYGERRQREQRARQARPRETDALRHGAANRVVPRA
ncbi:MAG: hypothetical protein L0Y54_12610 [Sporichthyaceae bacterium]|nr:hypothetical protein [Sporichthyaceae bacterium]